MGTAQVQGKLWGAAAADWSQLNEPACIPLYEAIFDAVALGTGTRLLDVGCGAGLALQLADKRGATVTGLDASEGLLAVARERVPAADLRQHDLENLPYPGGSFDAVTAFNSVQYAGDPVAALREMRRVAVPGAPVALVTWAEAERCETRVVLAAIGGLLQPAPPESLAEQCRFYGSDPASPFVRSALAAQMFDDGWVTVTRERVSGWRAGSPLAHEVSDDADWRQQLQRHLGLTVDGEQVRGIQRVRPPR